MVPDVQCLDELLPASAAERLAIAVLFTRRRGYDTYQEVSRGAITDYRNA